MPEKPPQHYRFPANAPHRQTHQSTVVGDWLVRYTFEEQNGSTIIAGVNITPNADPLHSTTPEPGTAPPGGLRARDVRRIPMGAPLVNAKTQDGRPDYPSTMPPARRPGSRGRDDDYYLAVAVRYVQAVERGSRQPTVDVTAQMGGFRRSHVRDLISEARRRGLLTAAPRGRAGGRLTRKAARLLEHTGEPAAAGKASRDDLNTKRSRARR